MDNEDAGDVEHLKIVNHILMSSPPGQFNDVLEDVKKLVSPELLNTGNLQAIAKAFNECNARIVQHDGHSFVIAKEGEIDKTHYIDSIVQKVVKVDHLNASVISVNDEQIPELYPELESLRSSAEDALSEYRESYFFASSSASGVFSTSSGKLVFYISAEHLNLRNWWSGSWMGRYELSGVSEGSGDATISGHISACGHYFENGNMQLRSKKDLPVVSLKKKDGSYIPAAINWIKEQESLLQKSIEDMYAGMNSTLKGMRRPVTVTAEKFSWQINQIKVRNTFIASTR